MSAIQVYVNNRMQATTQCGQREREEERRKRDNSTTDIFHKISRPRASVNRPLIAEILCGAWHVFILTGKSLIVAAMGNRGGPLSTGTVTGIRPPRRITVTSLQHVTYEFLRISYVRRSYST